MARQQPEDNKVQVNVTVIDQKSELPISNAPINVNGEERARTGKEGTKALKLTPGKYQISTEAFGLSNEEAIEIPEQEEPEAVEVELQLDLDAKIEARSEDFSSELQYCVEGQVVGLRAEIAGYDKRTYEYSWSVTGGNIIQLSERRDQRETYWDTDGAKKGKQTASVTITDKTETGEAVTASVVIYVRGDGPQAIAQEVQATRQEIAGQIQTTRESGVTVDMERARRKGTPEILTWEAIKMSTDALSFNNYQAFMDYVLCNDSEALLRLEQTEQDRITGPKAAENTSLRQRRFLPYTDTEAYRLLKIATEAFLIVNCGIPLDGFIDDDIYQQLLDTLDAEDASGKTTAEFWQQFLLTVNGDESYVLPYLLLIRNKLPDVPIKKKIFAQEVLEEEMDSDEAERCYGILMEKLFHPCMVELIWSYWHEEGMLVQTMNAISRRFQNVRGPEGRDPLAMVEVDPLRPLNNLLWGYIQDEQHRLTVVRRAYEYDHHYGLSLEGKVVPTLRTADSRGRFLEAFHQMLHLASVFYKQDDDTTMVADGFALLNGLRDLHMILTEGQHNQYGDLPTTARIEMLMQQWLMARPEFRELLPRRVMVGYPEAWMDTVDAMKRIQGWTDTSITHFRFLAIYGEQILLSVRFTRWSELDDAELAAIWARLFRNEVKGYIHAYRAVTGVDLSAEITTTQQRELIVTKPSVLLRQRLQSSPATPALPPGTAAAAPQPSSFRERRAARRAERK